MSRCGKASSNHGRKPAPAVKLLPLLQASGSVRFGRRLVRSKPDAVAYQGFTCGTALAVAKATQRRSCQPMLAHTANGRGGWAGWAVAAGMAQDS